MGEEVVKDFKEEVVVAGSNGGMMEKAKGNGIGCGGGKSPGSVDGKGDGSGRGKRTGSVDGKSDGGSGGKSTVSIDGKGDGSGRGKKNKTIEKETIEDIVRRAKEGNEEAIQAVIEQYKPFVIKCCHKFNIPSYDFEDLVQYSYLSILKSIKLYNFGRVHFTSYVMTAISNNLGDLLRRNVKQYNEVHHQEGFEMDFPDSDFNLERVVEQRESMRELNEALGRLDKDERDILVESYFKKMPLRVIAEVRGYSCSGMIKKRNRILKKVRETRG